MLSPTYEVAAGDPGTKKARIIRLPQTQYARELEQKKMGNFTFNAWHTQAGFSGYKSYDGLRHAWLKMCEETLLHPGLIESLRKEKFDVAYGESLTVCSVALFHLIGIKKYVFTESVAILDGNSDISHTPNFASYIPTLMQGFYGDKMTIVERTYNFLGDIAWKIVYNRDVTRTQKMLEKHWKGFPDMKELMAQASLVFYNCEPLVDFPKITSSRLLDIGGISVSAGHNPVNKTWSDILDLRPKTILISFGTVAQSFQMPDMFKETIIETVAQFPDVTFIWKYEKPEHEISKGISNIIEATWIPQKDILHDPRLTAFVTHCGQGSTTEAYSAGIPLVVFPIFADQMRNAQQVKRNGVGMLLTRDDLSDSQRFAKTIKEIITVPRYRKRAAEIKNMLKDRPFPAKEASYF